MLDFRKNKNLGREIRDFLRSGKPLPGENSLPAFSRDWLYREPRIVLPEEQILFPKSADRHVPGRFIKQLRYAGLAAAAVLLLFTGLFFLSDRKNTDQHKVPESALIPVFAVRTEGKAYYSLGKSDSAGQRIFFGDQLKSPVRIRTEKNADLALSVYPGTILRLRPESEILIEKNSLDPSGNPLTEIRLESGEVLSLVNKAAAKGKLTVAAKDALIQVKGTVFTAGIKNGTLKLSVAEGAVSVKKSSAESYSVGKGEELTIEPDSSVVLQENLHLISALGEEIENMLFAEKSVAAAMRRALDEAPRIPDDQLSDESTETIFLKDGRELRGIVISQSGDRLLIQTRKGKVFVNRSEITRIVYP